MINDSIPACYFPSTVLFLDNNLDLLQTTIAQHEPRFFYKLFAQVSEALNYLNDSKYHPELLNQYCFHEKDRANNLNLFNHITSEELTPIYAEVFNPARYSEISVVVVAFRLLECSALEFLQHIGNNLTKKIVLIDVEDELDAMKAQTEGLIDSYVIRTQPDFANKIHESIERLQWSYFQSMTNVLFRILSVPEPIFLQSHNFLVFFDKLLKKKDTVEFYLIDKTGAFLLLDAHGKVSYLVLKTKMELELTYQKALEAGVGDDVLERLASGKYLPSFNKEANLRDQTIDWINFLVPAKWVEDHEFSFCYADLSENKFIDGLALIPSYYQYSNDLAVEESFLS